MENIDSNENMNILEELDRKSSSPSLEFKNSLKTRVISHFHEEPAEGRFFFNERTINFMSIFIVIISVGIVTGAGFISFNNGNQVLNIDTVAAVPSAKKPEILGGIIKNNPGALILQTEAVVSNDPSAIASIAETAQGVAVSSEVKGYNFSYSKATTEVGTNISCNLESVTKNIFNYTENNLNIYRVVSLDKKDNIIDSIQVESLNGIITSKYSRDGKEQIIFSSNNLEVVETPVSSPVSAPQISSDNIDKFFVNTQNLNEVTRDGKKYYVLESLGTYSCNNEVVNAVFKKWFNKDDFSLFKKETFKTNSNESNLIERTTYTIANQTVEFEDVEDNFLPMDAESTVDISKDDSLQTLQKFLTIYLDSIPGKSNVKNLEIANFQDISYMNRNFYEDINSYDSAINKQPKPFVSYQFDNVNVDVYNQDVNNRSIFLSTSSGIEQDIMVGEEFYSGELFSTALPVSFVGTAQSKKVLVVEINGLKYVFSSSNLDSIIKNGLSNLSLTELFYAD